MRRLAWVLLCLILLTGCVWELPDSDDAVPLRVTVLDVGQGLCVLVESRGEAMLYDGGGRASSSYVVGYLKNHGVSELKLMVASHYDEDHISGLSGVLNTCRVERVLRPDYQADSRTYSAFLSALEKNGAETEFPQAGGVYRLGDAEILVCGPKQWDYEKENDRSIVLRISCGDVSVLLTGDAEFEAEAAMVASDLPLKSDVLVAGHHGSAASSSGLFLDAVKPAWVIVSCGKDNAYGHPAPETLARLRLAGAAIYRTDLQGEIILESDGTAVRFMQPPLPEETEVSPTPEYRYVVNEKSMKFHLPDCPGVSQMLPENRRNTDESREELIAQGYAPCGSCKP